MISKHNFYELTRNGKPRYFCLANPLERECYACKKLISDPVGIYAYSLFNNNRHLGIYHIGCKKKISTKSNYLEIGLCNFILDRIPGSVPVLFGYKYVKPSNNNITVFDAVDLVTDKTTDKTVHAGRDSLQGCSVGLIDHVRFNELDSDVNVDFYLDLQKNSKPVVNKNNLLEEKNE